MTLRAGPDHLRPSPALLGVSALLAGTDLGVDLPLVSGALPLIGGAVAHGGYPVPLVALNSGLAGWRLIRHRGNLPTFAAGAA